MSAFLTSLGSIASQYGEARNEKSTEDFARQQKLKEMSQQDAYLQLAKQAEARQQAEFEQRKKAGDLIEFKDGRIWSVSQGKFIEQNRPDPMTTLRKFIDSQPPEVRRNLTERAQAEVELNPNDPKAAIQEVMRYADETQKEQRQAAEKQKEYDERKQDRLTEYDERRKERIADRETLMRFAKGLADQKPSADEIRRADLAQNVNENLDAIEEIVQRRPDLFGPAHGLLTSIRAKVGTGDEDIAALEQARDNLGRALQGAHGMRSATGVISAGNSVLNGFRNSDKAVLAAIQRARSSVGTFIADVQRKAGTGGAGAETGTPPPGSVIHDFSH